MQVSFFPSVVVTNSTYCTVFTLLKVSRNMILVFLCLPVSTDGDSNDAVCGFLFILYWFECQNEKPKAPPPRLANVTVLQGESFKLPLSADLPDLRSHTEGGLSVQKGGYSITFSDLHL